MAAPKIKSIVYIAFFALQTCQYLSCSSGNSTKTFSVNDRIKGICLTAPADSFVSDDLKPISQINANYIAVIPYAFCPIDSPAVIYNKRFQYWGEKKEGVAETINMARENGLKIMLKPQIWLHNGAYTGKLTFQTEKQWQTWETEYERYILDFAKLADSMNVEMFCLGTELGNSIKERPLFWEEMITETRKIFKGKITYAANWDDYDKVPFWKNIDLIGIDAYFPLSNLENPKKNNLEESWKAINQTLAAFAENQGKKIIFTEIGYCSAQKACFEPWKNPRNAQIDMKNQVIAYESFFENVYIQNWFAGAFIWKWHLDEQYVSKANNDFTPQNKPAEEIIKKAFAK